MAPTAPDLTQRLAHHVVDMQAAALPPATRHAAARALLDAVGVMSAASGLSVEARPFLELAGGDARVQGALVLGTALRTGAATAALANGALAHALDYEDAFDHAPVHPNASLIPAVLALAQTRGPVSGDELLTAIAVGCDFTCRLGLSLRQPMEQGGWYPPPILGGFGAVAAAARLLRLSARQLCDAWSMLLLQNSCPGQLKYDADTVLRAVREAFPAQAAVMAVELAGRDVRGFAEVFEGRAGFYALFAGGRYEPQELFDGLGERWLVEQLSFKAWPSCRGTHAAIEAAITLRESPSFDPAKVTGIHIEGGAVQAMLAEPLSRKQAPRTAIDARFSLPFTVATALHHGSVGLPHFEAAALEDAAVLSLAARCRFSVREAWGTKSAVSGAVTLETTDAPPRTVELTEPLGSPARPLDDAALVRKFVDCLGQARRPLTPGAAAALADRLLHLATEPDAGALLQPA